MSEPTDRPASTAGLADPDDYRANCGVGVVMDLDGDRTHGTVADGVELLENLEHRGTTGADENTGDGAGILLQTPHEFFADEIDDLPAPGEYAVGSIFMPKDADAAAHLQDLTERVLSDHGLDVFAWRDVPTDPEPLGETATESEPAVVQCFVRSDLDDDAFDRALYVGRRDLETTLEDRNPEGAARFYICSLDRKTVVYKGLLTAEQLPSYYPDLLDERVRSTFAMVHARFSTNTLGAWHLAHPYRTIIHNGEFNTIQGNINWMRARENDLEHADFGDDIDTLRPIINDPDQSDTASVDNALELLMAGGREMPHALRMLIPEAWRVDANRVSEDRHEWYDYHASLVEPWDGPALVAATDGDRIGAVLDRNGLRPCRYDVTSDNTLVMASEAGALEYDFGEIERRDRLQPGQLFVADPEEGRVIPDEEIFDDLVDEKYGEWVASEQVGIDDIADDADAEPRDSTPSLRSHQALYGYTEDEMKHLIEPMARDGKDPVGSMGDDTPLSVLSQFNRPLFTYFKQLFAQVTNPPLDYIREELVTSLESRLGFQRNLLDETPEHARQLVVDSPILTDAQTSAIKELDGGLSTYVLDITFDPESDLETAVEDVRAEATEAAREHDIIVLSDRDAGPDAIPIPALLATAGVHHHLVRNGLRNHVGMVLESGDPRAVHHVATCVGYGAGAVNPYLAY
ncbi:MAG: glutamate synthase central domain-containing protein, partial [Natronomonas sp.]|nr:glutamate synthase central domain-containing protein [Natronomonas sp.]